jgi:hypothetical protein
MYPLKYLRVTPKHLLSLSHLGISPLLCKYSQSTTIGMQTTKENLIEKSNFEVYLNRIDTLPT